MASSARGCRHSAKIRRKHTGLESRPRLRRCAPHHPQRCPPSMISIMRSPSRMGTAPSSPRPDTASSQRLAAPHLSAPSCSTRPTRARMEPGSANAVIAEHPRTPCQHHSRRRCSSNPRGAARSCCSTWATTTPVARGTRIDCAFSAHSRDAPTFTNDGETRPLRFPVSMRARTPPAAPRPPSSGDGHHTQNR